MSLAYTAYDLARYTEGCFVLGLGSQVKAHIEREFSMPWSHPAARMREYIAALRAIWACWRDGVPLSFADEFYRHELMTPDVRPDRARLGAPAGISGRCWRADDRGRR
jgi:alkanesulfonate monooxygenase SsuD/methylene tetrahydromethanopterin reductase-like flavin-dependent oxidoreductase (luciferase family)